MENKLKGAIAESLPADVSVDSLPTDVNQDVKPDSSKAALVETPTPKVEQEIPFHQHPRWQEVMEEKRQAQERADRLEQQLLDISSRLSTPREPDPESGMAPEEKAFWQKQRQIAREEAEKVTNQKESVISQELQSQKAYVLSLMYERFQQKHPDITPGSQDENSIAQKVRQGYSLEDAYTLVTSPRRIKEAEDTARNKYIKEMETKNKQRVAANLEGPGVSPTSPIQPGKKLSTADIVDQYWNEKQGG